MSGIIGENQPLAFAVIGKGFKEGDTFFRQQPEQKGVVTLAVLNAELAYRMFVTQQQAVFRHAVFRQQRSENGFNILILETAEILPVDAAPEGRTDFHLIGRFLAVVFMA